MIRTPPDTEHTSGKERNTDKAEKPAYIGKIANDEKNIKKNQKKFGNIKSRRIFVSVIKKQSNMKAQRDTQIYVGMKFRIDGLCSDHDQIITAVTDSMVVTRSLTHNKYLSRFGYKEVDCNGFPIHRYCKDDFLNNMNPYRYNAIIPYNGDSRF